MAADSVEREILIEASPEVVWGVITKPEQICRWLSDEAEIEGRTGTLTWRPGGRAWGSKDLDTVVPIRVIDAEPFRRFSFRWNQPDGAEPDPGNSALVEFSLEEEAGGTRLRVVESGIAAVTGGEEGRSRYVDGHSHGWEKHLGELRDYIAAGPRGAAPR